MKASKLFLVALLSVLCLVSCKKDDGEELTKPGKTYEFLNATSYTDWVYFSFEKGAIVEVSDHKNDLSWDIAFHRGDIRLNGGESGKGQGGAINTNTTDWDAVKDAPASGYVTDKVGTITTAFTGEGIETAEQPFSQTLATWLIIDTSNPPPVYRYNNWIYVIKMADGRYAKLHIYDYKNEKNAGAYISFRYQYNGDGSTDFRAN